jgi:hypothetical protein
MTIVFVLILYGIFFKDYYKLKWDIEPFKINLENA